MEAKDTVMKIEKLAQLNSAMPPEAKYGEVFKVIAEEQAELSFKAGLEQGRREEQRRVANYLIERYGGVGRNASRRAAYNVAKELALDLTFKSVGINLGG